MGQKVYQVTERPGRKAYQVFPSPAPRGGKKHKSGPDYYIDNEHSTVWKEPTAKGHTYVPQVSSEKQNAPV